MQYKITNERMMIEKGKGSEVEEADEVKNISRVRFYGVCACQ